MTTRDLDWDGCINARDLGGLPVVGGGSTRRAAIARSDSPAELTYEGWTALRDHGVRTVLSLHTTFANLDSDRRANIRLDPASCASGLRIVSVAIEDGEDPAFAAAWSATGLWNSPLYYRDALARWPHRHATAIAEIARAAPGGVLIHSGRGCDRTGLISLLLLAAVGVEPAAIVDDYLLSAARLAAREPDYPRWLDDTMAAHGTTARAEIESVLQSLDVEAYLLSGGLAPAALAAVRSRLL